MSLASKANSVTLNKTYLNVVEIFNNIFNEHHQNWIFDSYTDSEKGVILS